MGENHDLIGFEVRYYDKFNCKDKTSVVVSSKAYKDLAGNRKVLLTLENGAVVNDQDCWLANFESGETDVMSGLRFVRCSACGAARDITREKLSVKSLLSGDGQTVLCDGCGRLIVFKIEGRVVVLITSSFSRIRSSS